MTPLKGDKDGWPLVSDKKLDNLTHWQWEALGVSDKVCDGVPWHQPGRREEEEATLAGSW